MNCTYSDIISRIPEPPKWWDEHAVPRYCAFAPNEVADIYAHDVALVRIKCQACGERFKVVFSWQRHEMGTSEDGKFWVRNQPEIDPTGLHYGDPPNACCASGATMNSVPLKVLEWWHRENMAWMRVPEKEVEIDCAWR